MAKEQGTREKLMGVAQELIQKRGVNAFSFQDLSDAVGIRKASVHHHFASKAVLIEALTQKYIEEFDVLTKDIADSDVSGKTKLKRYCNLFLQTLQAGKNDKSCLCGMLMAEVDSVEATVKKQIRRFLRGNLSRLENIIKEGVKDGTLAQQGNVKASALLVLSSLEGGLLIARCDQGPKQLSDLVTRLLSLLSD